MGFLKYWYISLFFIAGTAFGKDNSRTIDFWAWPSSIYLLKVITWLYDASSNLEDKSIQLDGGFGAFLLSVAPEVNVSTEYYVADEKGPIWNFCQVGAYSSFNSTRGGCKHDFKKNDELIILIHGFISHYDTKWARVMIGELKNKKNATIISVGWKVNKCLVDSLIEPPYKNSYDYFCVFANIWHVINLTSNFLEDMTNQVKSLKPSGDKPWKHIHIVGHSLGAHIAGKVAEKFTEKTSITVDRITGLDPALPCFPDSDSIWRLNKSHAKFVDVIHTNSDERDKSTLGLYENIGHVDIYPNYGNNQPNCTNRTPKTQTTFECTNIIYLGLDLAQNLITTGRFDIICNHSKAPDYMALSIMDRNCDYRAVPWDDIPKLRTQSVDQVCKNSACVEMGFNATKPSNIKSTGTKYYIDMSKFDGNCHTLP